jgi:hypothetical protein
VPTGEADVPGKSKTAPERETQHGRDVKKQQTQELSHELLF